MDEVRLIDGNAIENELREFAAQIFVGCHRTTTDTEEAVHTCADMVSGAPTIDPEDLPPQWRKSSEDPPTREDADEYWNVLVWNGRHAEVIRWDNVVLCPLEVPYWMPCPKPPREQDSEVRNDE